MILKKWKHPKHYMGETYYDYYILYARTRDSGLLQNHNWTQLLESLGGETCPEDEGGLIIARASHFAVGWIELMMIHENATDVIAQAEDLLQSLAEYPILNEDEYWNIQHEFCQEYWSNASLYERVEICQKSQESIFAARSDYYPSECMEEILVDCE